MEQRSTIIRSPVRGKGAPGGGSGSSDVEGGVSGGPFDSEVSGACIDDHQVFPVCQGFRRDNGSVCWFLWIERRIEEVRRIGSALVAANRGS